MGLGLGRKDRGPISPENPGHSVTNILRTNFIDNILEFIQKLPFELWTALFGLTRSRTRLGLDPSLENIFKPKTGFQA